jgi:hypothetical protein
VRAAADLRVALDAVPAAAMEAALNRVGRPTTSAEALRRHAERHTAALGELQEIWRVALAALPSRTCWLTGSVHGSSGAKEGA